jgi:hypothetical protein
VRDSERQRTYDAEMRAFEGTLVEAPLTFAEVLELTDALTATTWWRLHATSVTVVRGQGPTIHSRYCQVTRRIVLTEAQQNPLTLAHELAHAASNDGHGPRFRASLCALIHGLCGPTPSAQLQVEFQNGGLTVDTIDLDGLPDPPLLARHPRFGT